MYTPKELELKWETTNPWIYHLTTPNSVFGGEGWALATKKVVKLADMLLLVKCYDNYDRLSCHSAKPSSSNGWASKQLTNKKNSCIHKVTIEKNV